ncbi:MAG: hypothetical protein NZ922_04465 [Candidatus Methanomethyliaceae archaeon]|nr:hypothetical protein [Candidatus Methanomethyliaceae archaeon]MDW7971314.1 hypothetical protein [Nitrososphaerota archaeon]
MAQIKELGKIMPNGRVKCLYRGCGKRCSSWIGLMIHLKKCHGVLAEEVKSEEVFE